MGNLDQLLTVQDLDLRSDQLAHRRKTLPERAALTDLEAESEALAKTVETVTGERETFVREQKRYEDEAASVIAKAEATNATVYGGTVTSPRELQGMQDEIAALQRRQTQLEDQVLDLMERIEPLTGQLGELEASAQALEVRMAEVREQITTADAEIDSEEAEVLTKREAAAEEVPGPLLSEYENLRSQFGGIGVAKLNGDTCAGCFLSLSAIEVDRIKKLDAEAVVHCEECGRMLIR